MAKFERTVNGNYNEIKQGIYSEISSSAVSMTLVDKCEHILQDTRITLYVFDKYYMRAGNRASLSVSIIGHGNKVHVSAIGSGGGQGVFFRFSWGAEDNILKPVKRYLEEKYPY